MSHIIGIGTDITECGRVARMLDKHGDHFIKRVYTDAEIAYCEERKQRVEHYTGRWCAKEAILKAIGTGWIRGIAWRDIEILNEPSGKPVVKVRGGVRDIIEEKEIGEIQITISHCKTHAVAYAIATGRVY